MKAKGLPMSQEMVIAILERRKDMTRRVMRPQPVLDGLLWTFGGAAWDFRSKRVPVIPCHGMANRNPYGMPGDLCYIKEKWALRQGRDGVSPSQVSPRWFYREPVWFGCGDGSEPDTGQQRGRWRSGRFMPQWASRILVRITDVWVEQVQNISIRDCIREGIRHDATPEELRWIMATESGDYRHKEAFAALWDSINAARGFGWAANPWNWAYTIEIVEIGRAA